MTDDDTHSTPLAERMLMMVDDPAEMTFIACDLTRQRDDEPPVAAVTHRPVTLVVEARETTAVVAVIPLDDGHVHIEVEHFDPATGQRQGG